MTNRIFNIISILLLSGTALCPAADGELGSKPPVTSAERVHNRIGLIGGRMVADMAEYGYFETALTALWTHQPPFPRPPVRPNGCSMGLPSEANS